MTLDTILIENIETHHQSIVKLSEIHPVQNKNIKELTKYPDFSLISSKDWQEARKRKKIIHPLAQLSECPNSIAKKAGLKLGCSMRHIYKLIKHYRNSQYNLCSLLPFKPSGGVGKGRISAIIEDIILQTIEKFYLSKQKFKLSVVFEEIRRLCYRANIKSPSLNTVRLRIANRNLNEIIEKREGKQIVRQKINPIVGAFPEVKNPLAVVQIDHTVVDLIIVDETYRKPIGRPYITIAIDVFSRCITGFYLTLEPPSAVSVGMCLIHAIFNKEEWLKKYDLDIQCWPIWGIPSSIYVDNAKEFHSEALERGCEAHGIKIEYRPVKSPHYGGIVERVIGTLMNLIHQLPGTTFSNVKERGNYNSEKNAIFTLAELEKWITVAITEYYHKKIHSSLNCSPIEKYKIGILGDNSTKGQGYPTLIYNKKEFLIDFLPIERRTLQRDGFTIDRIIYYSNILNPLIMNRKKYDKFIIRRDPRDLSRIYVFDPTSNKYMDIPYRDIGRPAITLWEHRIAIKELRSKNFDKINEDMIFRTVEHLREITNTAAEKRKIARRSKERKKSIDDTKIKVTEKPDLSSINTTILESERFTDVEEW
jgi:putative transposase